jgi:hypothetical protein
MHIKWFRSFGLSYFYDKYEYPWDAVLDGAHNIVFLFVRIQIQVKKIVYVNDKGDIKEVKIKIK